jgi:hypothetical protein
VCCTADPKEPTMVNMLHRQSGCNYWVSSFSAHAFLSLKSHAISSSVGCPHIAVRSRAYVVSVWVSQPFQLRCSIGAEDICWNFSRAMLGLPLCQQYNTKVYNLCPASLYSWGESGCTRPDVPQTNAKGKPLTLVTYRALRNHQGYQPWNQFNQITKSATHSRYTSDISI